MRRVSATARQILAFSRLAAAFLRSVRSSMRCSRSRSRCAAAPSGTFARRSRSSPVCSRLSAIRSRPSATRSRSSATSARQTRRLNLSESGTRRRRRPTLLRWSNPELGACLIRDRSEQVSLNGSGHRAPIRRLLRGLCCCSVSELHHVAVGRPLIATRHDGRHRKRPTRRMMLAAIVAGASDTRRTLTMLSLAADATWAPAAPGANL